jgi:hypothetical protein
MIDHVTRAGELVTRRFEEQGASDETSSPSTGS